MDEPVPARAPAVRLAAFLPAAVLLLLPLAGTHPALGLGPAFAWPAALAAAGWGPGYLERLAPRPLGGLWLLSFLALAFAVLLLGWPLLRLQRSGALGDVLLLSGACAALLLGLWRVWPALVLPLLWPQAARGGLLPMLRRCLVFGRQLVDASRSPLRDWLAAALLLLAVLAVAALAFAPVLALPRSSLGPWWYLGAVPLLLLTAWGLVECGARRLLDAEAASAPDEAPESEVAAPDASVPVPSSEPAPRSPQEALYAAARAGRVDEALSLLEHGVDAHSEPDPAARDQRSLPVLAALLSDLRLLRALIGAGVDVNRAHGGLTPLLAATRDSYHGRPDAVMTLLANGADPRIADSEGRLPLHGAALSADAGVAALLLDAGAPLESVDREGWTALGRACAHGNWRLARFLLDRGARPEAEGAQPALLAAASGEDDPAGVRLLLKHRARVDTRGRLQRSALHVACLAGNAAIAQALIEAGAEVDARDEHGVTPLHEAARAGSTAVIAALALRQPRADCVDAAGRNALVIACQSSRASRDAVDALLALGVDPRQAASDGRTALDHAVAAGRWAIVTRLDPEYALPACVADATEELEDVPLPARLRVALEARRHDHLRLLLPRLREAPELAASAVLDFCATLDRPAACLLLPVAADAPPDENGNNLMFRLLDVGPSAAIAITALLETGQSPTGAGGLARFLAREAAGDGAGEALACDLLACGADAFGAASDGVPPLHLALRREWKGLMAALLAAGVDPECRDPRGATALLSACALGNDAGLRLLLAHGAQPATRAADGQTPLGLALASGRPALARWLDWNRWPLPRRALRPADLPAAAQQGDSGAVVRLLDLGLPIDAVDAQGCTALLRACGGGHAALAELLLQRGADPRLPSRSGATCISAALSARQDAVLPVLLAHGAAPDQPLPGGITPLMVAAALGQARGVQILLAHGADALRLDEQGAGALHAAAQYGFTARDRGRALALWESLLVGAADLDAADAAGDTPLLLLLGARAGADTVCDEEVLLAQVERLLARGVRLGARERRGFGPLHLAALHGLGRIVRALLAAGADPDLRDNVNRRPQEIAVMRGFVDIAAEFDPPRGAPSIARFLRPS